MAALLFSGCSGGSAAKGSSDGSLNGKNVSVVTPYLSSVTTKQMVDNIERDLKAEGINVNVVDTKGDFGEQCYSSKIDGMKVNATSDNYEMGKTICRYLFEDLMNKKGTVIALTYRPHPGVVKRCEAFDEMIKDYPDISLITEQQVDVPAGPIESSREIMENLILSNPEKDSVTAVFAAWDEPAIGASQALEAAGRDEVIVTGVDGNSQAVEMIEKGSNLKATLSQNFDGMTDIVVKDVIDLLSGKEIETGEKYAPATLVTKK